MNQIEYFYTKCIGYIASTRLSGYFVRIYCIINGMDYDEIIQKYEPEGCYKNDKTFKTFSDFFSRKIKNVQKIIDFINDEKCNEYNFSMPCTSTIMELNKKIVDESACNIKNRDYSVCNLFNTSDHKISSEYFFSYFYLNPTNYHRVHSPISGKIVSIESNNGSLLPVNPKFYSNDLYPLIQNEKLIFVIMDDNNEYFFITCIAALGVSNIQQNNSITIGKDIKKGDELITFKLGSSVVCASKKIIDETKYIKKGNDVDVFTSSKL